MAGPDLVRAAEEESGDGRRTYPPAAAGIGLGSRPAARAEIVTEVDEISLTISWSTRSAGADAPARGPRRAAGAARAGPARGEGGAVRDLQPPGPKARVARQGGVEPNGIGPRSRTSSAVGHDRGRAGDRAVILKGMNDKEIAVLRGTSEATVRQGGRGDLSEGRPAGQDRVLRLLLRTCSPRQRDGWSSGGSASAGDPTSEPGVVKCLRRAAGSRACGGRPVRAAGRRRRRRGGVAALDVDPVSVRFVIGELVDDPTWSSEIRSEPSGNLEVDWTAKTLPAAPSGAVDEHRRALGRRRREADPYDLVADGGERFEEPVRRPGRRWGSPWGRLCGEEVDAERGDVASKISAGDVVGCGAAAANRGSEMPSP